MFETSTSEHIAPVRKKKSRQRNSSSHSLPTEAEASPLTQRYQRSTSESAAASPALPSYGSLSQGYTVHMSSKSGSEASPDWAQRSEGDTTAGGKSELLSASHHSTEWTIYVTPNFPVCITCIIIMIHSMKIRSYKKSLHCMHAALAYCSSLYS